MPDAAPTRAASPDTARLTGEEQRSLTHGEFWIPEPERGVYRDAMRALHQAGVPFVVSGLYAIYEYTGSYRETKDLDLFFEPRHLLDAAKVLKSVGFTLRLEEAHWLAKAQRDDQQIDLIFGIGNGIVLIDEDWFVHARRAVLAGLPVRVAPPEEILWHRLFVSERHRSDMFDNMHLILCRGDVMDWDRVLRRVHDHWRLLLAQIHVFDYVYPGHRARVPRYVRDELYARAATAIDEVGDPSACHGTLISRFSFNIDVTEWGFRDPREEAIARTRQLPIVGEIIADDVWDE